MNIEYDKIYEPNQLLCSKRKKPKINKKPMRMLLRIREIIYGITKFNQSKLLKQEKHKKERKNATRLKTKSKMVLQYSRESNC